VWQQAEAMLSKGEGDVCRAKCGMQGHKAPESGCMHEGKQGYGQALCCCERLLRRAPSPNPTPCAM
jgi:hypothetical protein